MSGSTTGVTCALCANNRVRVEDELSGKEIRTLWRVHGRIFSSDALAPVEDTTRVRLYRCGACGFRFYDSSLAGFAKFYEELMAGAYYAQARPEFDFALKHACARNLKSVLDVGGGEGGFLDLAKQQGLKTFGVELNAAAAARAQAKGHAMIGRPLQEIDRAELNGGVDLLTLHQVVEHVPEPITFLQQASRLVRPGGYVVVAVPNEKRLFGLVPYDPANWPPHHITRWRRKDLHELARRAGLHVVAAGGDVLYGAAFEQFIPWHNRLAAAIGRPTHSVDERGARVFSFLYRKLGLKHFLPRLGLSIYILAQKEDRR